MAHFFDFDDEGDDSPVELGEGVEEEEAAATFRAQKAQAAEVAEKKEEEKRKDTKLHGSGTECEPAQVTTQKDSRLRDLRAAQRIIAEVAEEKEEEKREDTNLHSSGTECEPAQVTTQTDSRLRDLRTAQRIIKAWPAPGSKRIVNEVFARVEAEVAAGGASWNCAAVQRFGEQVLEEHGLETVNWALSLVTWSSICDDSERWGPKDADHPLRLAVLVFLRVVAELEACVGSSTVGEAETVQEPLTDLEEEGQSALLRAPKETHPWLAGAVANYSHSWLPSWLAGKSPPMAGRHR